MLNGVAAALRTREKPPSRTTSLSRFSPACAPSAAPTSWLSDGRHADVGRARIVDAPDRVEVVGEAVARHRLDQHQRAVGLQRLADMRDRADRIAHVVQRVEHGDEVVVRAVDSPARAPSRSGRCSGPFACLPGVRDRGVVEVDADELATSGTPAPSGWSRRRGRSRRRRPWRRARASRPRRRAPAAIRRPGSPGSRAGRSARRRRTGSCSARPSRGPCRS